MENNLPQIRKEGFFKKVKNWFSKLFYEKKIKENKGTEKESEIEVFKESIKVEGKDRLLLLQRKLKEGQIEISELTDEELNEMITLYETQIEEKKNTLKQLKNKLSTDNKEE